MTSVQEADDGYVTGKPPSLTTRSLNAIRNYFFRLDLYFGLKNIEADTTKISWADAGLRDSTALQWFRNDHAHLASLTYAKFKAELLAKILQRGVVADLKEAMHDNRQGERAFRPWAEEMTALHLQIGTAVMSDDAFIDVLLLNMNRFLARTLRSSEKLRGTGFHLEDLDGLAIERPPGTTTKITLSDFLNEASARWDEKVGQQKGLMAGIQAKFKEHRAAATAQDGCSDTTSKKKVGNTGSRSGGAKASGGGNRLQKLTAREKDYLSSTNGCFKCRRPHAGHQSTDCPNGFPATTVSVPSDFQADSGETKVKVEHTATRLNKLGLGSSSDEGDDGQISETDFLWSDEECADFSCAELPVRIGSHAILALADSGCSSTVIDKGLVKRLHLPVRRLRHPHPVSLAVDVKSPPITHYTFIPLSLSNGKHSFGRTFAKIAPLSPPHQILLGSPFLHRHRLDLSFYPSPTLRRTDGVDLIALASEEGEEISLSEEEEEEDDVVPVGPLSLTEIHTAIQTRIAAIETTQSEEKAARAASDRLRKEFADLFPTELPAVRDAPTDDKRPAGVTEDASNIRHEIRLDDPDAPVKQRPYRIPRPQLATFKMLLEDHLRAGRLRPSSSPYSSPAFLIPKRDGTPRWVNDYRRLNSKTIKSRYPLPLPDDILSACGGARVWGKIDMTNSFFQTLMAPGDITKTAVSTPFGLYEWTVMPQGLCNAPATHQRRVNEALREQIGRICHVYIDDIIVWSNSIDEHETNVREVLTALRKAKLYCSPKKTDLVNVRCDFLGHVISRDGIGADPGKISAVRSWPTPKTVKDLRSFLGLVQYLRKFLDRLAEHTAALTPLIRAAGKNKMARLDWTNEHQSHFDAIKQLVTTAPILRTIDYDSEDPIWLMADASDLGIGAVLLQGPAWKEARPIAFESRQYTPAEQNYPTHEKELLAIVHALKKWRADLLGVRVHVKTDHDTLVRFFGQRDLSRRQARWSETLADYDIEIEYVPGEANSAADAMSRHPLLRPSSSRLARMVAGLSVASLNEKVIQAIKEGYLVDEACTKLVRNLGSIPSLELLDGILFQDGRIVVPNNRQLREMILHDAHDACGHLGSRKTYERINLSFTWTGLRQDVVKYVHSCDACQRHKSRTTRPAGKIRMLPVPDRPLADVAIDFVGPLPRDGDHDMLLTVTDRFSGLVSLIPTRQNGTASDYAAALFHGWYRHYGLPRSIVSDRDKSFVRDFWKKLHALANVRLLRSTAFHPETDGRSERTNKTVIQILRTMVNRQHNNWVKALTSAEYAINSSVNVSTGRTPFEVVLGFTPVIVPEVLSRADHGGEGELSGAPSPSVRPFPSSESDARSPGEVRQEDAPNPEAEAFWSEREAAIIDAKATLEAAKVEQADQANKRRGEDPVIQVGDLVMLDSKDRRARYKATNQKRSTKLFPRSDGPYRVKAVFDNFVQLELDGDDKSFSKFHVHKVRPYHANDPSEFPSRQPERPGPVIVGGEEEFEVDDILDEKGTGARIRYLVERMDERGGDVGARSGVG